MIRFAIGNGNGNGNGVETVIDSTADNGADKMMSTK